jgi:GTPase SAR1 family protein
MSDHFSQVKEELLQCIDEMFAIENIPGCPCEELRDKVKNNVFNLVVLGQFKRGKTSLINALLGAEILPTAVVPLTSIATVLKYGEALRIKVYLNDGSVKEIRHENLSLYVTEKGNPENEKNVREVVVTYPSHYLKDGVQLIDTPGVGSVYHHNTDIAYQYIPKSDAALFLLSVDQPVSRAELDFLHDVKEYSDRIFFLQNKADYVGPKDLEESIDFSRKVIRECIGSDITIFPVSSKRALDGKLTGSKEILEQSYLPGFEKLLHTFLVEEKGRVLVLSVSSTLLRALSQALLELELEMKSLATPVDELKNKIAVFENRKNDVLADKKDFDILLDGEVSRITKNVLDNDLEEFKKELAASLMPGLESLFKDKKGLSGRQLYKVLEAYVVDEVTNAYNNWRSKEDGKLADAFEAVCNRFTGKIDDTVDGLLTFSSELFSIPYEVFRAEELWTMKSRFYYKFRDEPVSLELITQSFTFVLPRIISDRIFRKKTREFMLEMIDKQGGRIRFDFRERLDKSKYDFRWKMLQRIETTIEGISSAINKGMIEKSKGEASVETRKQKLSATAHQINAVKGRLLELQRRISS